MLDLGVSPSRGIVREDGEGVWMWGGVLWVEPGLCVNVSLALSGVCRCRLFKIRAPPNLLGDLAFQSSFAQGILYWEVL